MQSSTEILCAMLGIARSSQKKKLKSRKIMRELGLSLERKDDFIEAISKLNEKWHLLKESWIRLKKEGNSQKRIQSMNYNVPVLP